MEIIHQQRIVLLGAMSKHTVAGVVWQTVHYLVGLKRLGYDVYYIEAHASTPTKFSRSEEDDGSVKAAAFISQVMDRFDLKDKWAFHALHADGVCYGMREEQLKQLYGSAELIINLHGATVPLPEHSATGRLIYLETDPVALQIELHDKNQPTVDFLEPHCAFFTFGENYGNPDCKLPVSDRFHFRATRQPVVLDFWNSHGNGTGECFTTVGNWQQLKRHREIYFRGEVYHWSKHYEFLKFLDLPRRTRQPFELALSTYDDQDKLMLESHGWQVRDALSFSNDTDAYRQYIARSRGEFTVAKDQNVRLRSGWFSDRSATYLAAGRPVITQETGFTNILPTGEGLFAFSTMDEIEQAVDSINSDYKRHSRAACDIAREYFDCDIVLKRLLADIGLTHRADGSSSTEKQNLDRQTKTEGATEPFPSTMVLTPISRWPTRLPEATVQTVLARPAPEPPTLQVDQRSMVSTAQGPEKVISIVIVTFNNLVFTRMCLESVLVNTDYPNYEIIVVDNNSSDGTTDYLLDLAQSYPQIRLVFNDSNRGFAPANNQGLAIATGEVLVLLNNDTIVARGWLSKLAKYLEDGAVGLAGPVTNRAGNEAQIDAPYSTYGEFLEFAHEYPQAHEGELLDIRTLTMFCVAMRREVYQQIGPLDERFEIGMFEDDDYAMRMRAAGYRVVCAEDVFVHHFGQASIGELANGKYGEIFHANRQKFEYKWGLKWEPYRHRFTQQYQTLIERIRTIVCDTIPAQSTVVVVSKGDEELIKLNGLTAWHFPQDEDGGFTGHYPADSKEAIAHLESLRDRGGDYLLIPQTSLWWLDHYAEFNRHLKNRYPQVVNEDEACLVLDLREDSKIGEASIISA